MTSPSFVGQSPRMRASVQFLTLVNFVLAELRPIWILIVAWYFVSADALALCDPQSRGPFLWTDGLPVAQTRWATFILVLQIFVLLPFQWGSLLLGQLLVTWSRTWGKSLFRLDHGAYLSFCVGFRTRGVDRGFRAMTAVFAVLTCASALVTAAVFQASASAVVATLCESLVMALCLWHLRSNAGMLLMDTQTHYFRGVRFTRSKWSVLQDSRSFLESIQKRILHQTTQDVTSSASGVPNIRISESLTPAQLYCLLLEPSMQPWLPARFDRPHRVEHMTLAGQHTEPLLSV